MSVPPAAIRVVQIGTGNVGTHALRALITNPAFELAGVWVSSAIPAVVAAEPGICTTLHLPLVTGRGLYASS